MAEKRKLEFFVLRYVPDAVKGEFVNFGLVMIESPTAEFADVRFTRDWRRVLCLNPDADVEMLQAMESDVRKRVVEVRNCEEVMRVLNDSLSNVVQLSGVKGCLAEDPTKELGLLARAYLMRAGHASAISGRQEILHQMRGAWKQAGVEGFLRAVAAADYTGKGDPLVFDFGYRIRGEIKLFHAVSLKAGAGPAVMMGARYPKIAEQIVKKGAGPVLTAVVDDGLDRGVEDIGFALGMMEESGIRVRPVAEMPEIADAVRLELRA